jgi:hypothetical protein
MIVNEEESFESKLARFGRAMQKLVAAGIQIDGSSRLRQYERAVQQALDDPSPEVEESTIFILAHVLRDMDEIAEIVAGLPNVLDPETLRLLRELPGGRLDPDDESGAKAREAQYELYLGTLARRAGSLSVHGKPDLTITHEAVSYFVEAKRPGRIERFDDRLRSAVAQLAPHGEHGIVAISIDQLVRPPRTLMSVPSFSTLALAVASLVDEFVTQQRTVIRNRLRNSEVRAVLLTARVPARLADTGHLCVGTNIHIERMSSPEDRSIRFAERLVSLYLQAPAPSEA